MQQLRKAQDSLRMSAKGMILFGLWNLAKIFLYLLFAPDYLKAIFSIDDTPEIPFSYVMAFWIVLTVIALLLRLYIAWRAKRECSRGGGYFYLVTAGIILIVNFYGLVVPLINSSPETDLLSVLSNVLLSCAMLLNAGQLIYSAVRVKQLRKNLEVTAHAD